MIAKVLAIIGSWDEGRHGAIGELAAIRGDMAALRQPHMNEYVVTDIAVQLEAAPEPILVTAGIDAGLIRVAASGLCERSSPLPVGVLEPVWAAWPAIGFGARQVAGSAKRCRRPPGRQAKADHLARRLPAPCGSERPRRAARTRSAAAAAEKARDHAAHCDGRSRLPNAVDALPRVPV